MLEWLTAYPSLASPYTLTVALAVAGAAILMILRRPSAFLMLLLLLAPLPKLYSLGLTAETEEMVAGGQLRNVAKPGGSASELVLIAGFLAIPMVSLGRKRRESSSLGKMLSIWIVMVMLSAVAAKVFRGDAYPTSSLLHALRYAATVGCYFLGRRCLSRKRTEYQLGRLSRLLLISGNAYIVLSILYYLSIGSTTNPTQMLAETGGSGVWRNYLLFFDYAYDFGLYAATICAANLVAAVLSPTLARSAWCACGAVLCAVAALLTGERGNLLIVGATLLVSILILRRAEQRKAAKLAMRLALAAAAVTILVAGFQLLFTPAGMTDKLAGTVRADAGATAGVLAARLGVDQRAEDLLSSLPIGDYAIRLALMLGSITYFLYHPLGIGFGAELSATGWFAHHDLIRIAVELGVVGIIVFALVALRLASFSLSRLSLDRQAAPLVLAVQAVTGGMLIATCFAVMTMFSLKFGVVYWSLLGVIHGATLLRRDPTAARLRTTWISLEAVSTRYTIKPKRIPHAVALVGGADADVAESTNKRGIRHRR